MRELVLDLDQSLGRRAALEGAIRAAIGDGRLVAGATLPSTRTLATDLGLSRATVVAAYEQLAVEGYLTARQGSGTVVAAVHQPAPVGRTAGGLERRFAHDFRPGSPDVGLFPRAVWHRSARAVLAAATDNAFDYGDPAGVGQLREQLAVYLGRARAVVCDPGSVRIYGGFFAAVSFVAEALLARGVTRVGIEEPCLFVVRELVARAGLDVVPVPVDEEGISVDRLASADVGAVVVTPGHQFPTGVTMTADRRRQLVDWARTGERWIIEDDYDGEFRYDRQPVGSLQGLAPDRVVYAGTASKSLAPGLRLAWVVSPPGLRRTLADVTFVRAGVSTLEQLTLADVIERGELDRHIRMARTVYRRRRDALMERLAADVEWLRPLSPTSAGLHLAVVADGIDEEAMIESAASESIGLFGLGPHWAGQPAQRGLVLGFTRPPRHRFAEALDRLIAHLGQWRPAVR